VTSTGRVEVTTTIKVAREKAFDAWLTADRMARFLCAGDTHVESLEVDPRIGGFFRIVMANAKGSYDHRGRYEEMSARHDCDLPGRQRRPTATTQKLPSRSRTLRKAHA
jgi:uncharacterized protein YndB with AHSA1/START domain